MSSVCQQRVLHTGEYRPTPRRPVKPLRQAACARGSLEGLEIQLLNDVTVRFVEKDLLGKAFRRLSRQVQQLRSDALQGAKKANDRPASTRSSTSTGLCLSETDNEGASGIVH